MARLKSAEHERERKREREREEEIGNEKTEEGGKDSERAGDAKEQSEERRGTGRDGQGRERDVLRDSGNGRNISRAKLRRRPLPARIDARRSDAAAAAAVAAAAARGWFLPPLPSRRRLPSLSLFLSLSRFFLPPLAR